ncbi:thiol-disulfide oxidoreductase DCC [Sphingobium chlorophenolicum L-1]|uniref:Thiol-disulfide oxidoreductase DCC n=1 Tax=Sphingobium chlorophenolicum L-1 TaxID=690566 RepID=F6EYI3_SPHCR|nr:DCC1-like thiol-disulfide oxidoreductase family protein [Sphingobium chlorophenolicum]AEG49185.1 thiol-disulfide oxidoreductase DCC [Sphingobium chlorophenolicum L-1]
MPEVSTQAFSYRDDPSIPSFDDDKALFVFDGICVLCSGGASWLMRHDRNGRVNFTPAQERLGQSLYTHYGVEMDESYLLIANGRAYTASRGYIELCRILSGWWRPLCVFAGIPERLRDGAYAVIARNRYRWFGKSGYCELLTDAQRKRLI